MLKVGRVYVFEGSPFIYEGADGVWAMIREYPLGMLRKYHPDEVRNLPAWSEKKDGI